MDRTKQRTDFKALAARLTRDSGPTKTQDTEAARRARMASRLLSVADVAVGQAEKFSDPTKVGAALGNAQRALELAEKLAPKQAPVGGHWVEVVAPTIDAETTSADSHDPIQQTPG